MNKIKNKSSIQKNIKVNKKMFIIFVSCIMLISLATLLICVFKEKNKNINDIVVSELDFVKPLDKDDEAQAAKLIKNNIVKIVNKIDDDSSITGTGFFIKEGYLVTNSHVVDIMGDISIEYSDGSQEKAYLFSNSINYDIALLKVENVKVKSLIFGSSNDIEVTNDVLSAGYIYNFKGEATVSKGILSARRINQSVTYLQSDIAIDSGSSGGPLFDSKANVIGINTFVTENRTFAIALSSESASLIIDGLLGTPSIEYLTESRPSNAINEILVEVGYTEDSNFDLYKDEEKVKKSQKEHKKSFEELEEKDMSNTHKKEKYYCDSGYVLIGQKCIKTEEYMATVSYENCKEGYEKDFNKCIKNEIVDAKANYPCSGKLTEKHTCLEETIQVGGGESVQKRWGSCPKGKTCYDLGKDYVTNNLYKKFIGNFTCPVGSTKLSQGNYRFVWDGEEINQENIKQWNTKEPGAYRSYDADGIEYYIDTTSILSMCAKNYDATNDVYVLYTNEELRNTACSEGGTFTSHVNNQGFYCLLSTTIHMYAWDPVCYDSAYSWIKYGGTYYCGRIVENEYTVDPYYVCNEGTMRSDGKTCLVRDEYYLTPNYSCSGEDRLSSNKCLKTITISANKR